VLKQHNKNVAVVAVEPKDSPVLSGGKPGAHKIQGIGAGFIPEVLNIEIIDEIMQVSNDDAMETARQLAAKEGILVGISSGAAMWAAIQLSQRAENQGKTIVVILPDTGERYISTEMFDRLQAGQEVMATDNQ
jgi:cysteine synthase A